MSDQLFSVQAKKTLVSGGSRGIGLELARGFAERGADVTILGRDKERLAAAQEFVRRSAGVVVNWMVCDVSDTERIRSVVNEFHADCGQIDVLLNVAGVTVRKPAVEYEPAEYDHILNINLRGAFFVAQEVGKRMLAQNGGVQVHVESYNTVAPLTNVMPYAISKFGMHGMIKGLATEWGPYGVRVNGIGPGFILTDLNRELWSQPHMESWALDNTPLRRLGKVGDLLGAAVFLASDASRFVTGQTLYIDGGVSAGTQWPIGKNIQNDA